MIDVQPFKSSGVLFLGEQNGPAESVLKARLIKSFEEFSSIQAAYLARVSYKETLGTNICLCLLGGSEKALEIVAFVSKDFKSVFNATEHLDTAFLAVEQIPLLEKVARPFYQRH